MPDAVYAGPSERLPWLPNAAPVSRPKRRRPWGPFAALAAAVGVVALSAWAWMERSPSGTSRTEAIETVPLPPPASELQEVSTPEGPSVGERDALRPVSPPSAEPVAAKRPKASPPPRGAKRVKAKPSARPAARAPSPYDPRAWRSGIPGRIIQLGAYRTSAQAQSEWRRVYARYPLLRPLSPRILKSRIRGSTYHRLQLGTFSQAHSELLCQRLRALGEGCTVLGLPRRGRSR
jgi:hypothetical protein